MQSRRLVVILHGYVSNHRRCHNNADPTLVSDVSAKHANPPSHNGHMLSLLPGDIKYESPSGNFRFYFPITTSILISIVLTLVLWLFS